MGSIAAETTSGCVAREESRSAERKKRRLHADERAQLIYRKIQAERQMEREKQRLEKECRQKAMEKYMSTKRKMNKALSRRNKRGQPNLNAQIEVLLEKIKKRTKNS